MEKAVWDLLVALEGAHDVAPQSAIDEAWAADGAVDRLRDAALALASSAPPDAPEWEARSVRDRIVRLLALTRGLACARAARDVARVVDAPYVASLTATRQAPDVCAQLVREADGADTEFLACLIQELVVRRALLASDPFARFWESVRSDGHRLGWLTLRLAPIEREIVLPSYSLKGAAYPAVGHASGNAGDADTTAAIAPVAGETTDASIEARLASAVRTWLEDSNGRVESRVFALDDGPPHVRLSDALAAANLDSVGAVGRPRIGAVAVADAFAALFAAASTGGAYDSGHGGAYGRLRAWQSVGALVGARADDPLEDVAELARRSRWYSFASDWFDDVAWDIGLAVVDPGGTRLAVLAATDTD